VTKLRLAFVHEYRDRHGRLRRYFRRKGQRQVPLPGLPGSAEFMAAYQMALGGSPAPQLPKQSHGTIDGLVTGFYRSAEFSNLAASSQKTYRAVLEDLREVHGDRLVHDLPPAKARKLIEHIGATRPGLANLTRSIFHRLFAYAIEIELRHDNPFSNVPRYRTGTLHTWTDQEISAFEKRWPLGTRERLVFALLLYTAQRGSDVVRMRRSDISGGAIRVVQQKTATSNDDQLLIAIHPALARVLKAGPASGVYLIGDEHGRPIGRQTLTRIIRLAAKAAGLPQRCVPHGLRKAALRRLAEHGSTTKEIAAVSGHRTLAEVERYTKRADQARLSQAAINRLPDDEHGE
jgi:integrase